MYLFFCQNSFLIYLIKHLLEIYEKKNRWILMLIQRKAKKNSYNNNNKPTVCERWTNFFFLYILLLLKIIIINICTEILPESIFSFFFLNILVFFLLVHSSSLFLSLSLSKVRIFFENLNSSNPIVNINYILNSKCEF